MSDQPLLEVADLEKHYPITEGLLRRQVGTVRAADGVSFAIDRGETFGLVGESGCGKSTTALSLLRLEEPTGGTIRFDGEDVLTYSEEELRRYRRRVGLILQDPDSAFDPRLTVGEAVAEPLCVHGVGDAETRRRVVADTLERVGMAAADADCYPHEFSGGEKQRIAIARALVVDPDLLVADEPTSALDGRTRAEILELLSDLRETFDLSVLFISHDLDTVRRFCDRIGVMYLGRIVERGPTADLVDDPKHPYTRMLVSSVPSLDPDTSTATVETPSDELPDASAVPGGCRFHTRCPAIIQPEAIDLPHEQWLNLMALRFALADEWDDAAAFEASSTLQADAAGDADLEARLRGAFDLPGKLEDDDAEAALAAAIGAIEGDDLGAARECLDDVLEGVCERRSPALLEEATSRAVACHRYDPGAPGEPTPAPRRDDSP